MELTERETLIKVEQQLKDSVSNQSQIMADLKEIFARLEKESKVNTVLNGDVKNLIYRVDDQTKRLEEINKRLDNLEIEVDEEEKNRIKSIGQESSDREKFQSELKGSFKTVTTIFGALATIAAIVSVIVAVMQFAQNAG